MEALSSLSSVIFYLGKELLEGSRDGVGFVFTQFPVGCLGGLDDLSLPASSHDCRGDLWSQQGPSHGELTNGVSAFIGYAAKFLLEGEEVSEILVRL